MKRHVEAVHEKKKLFKCAICDKSFARKTAMKAHSEIVHEKKKQ